MNVLPTRLRPVTATNSEYSELYAFSNSLFSAFLPISIIPSFLVFGYKGNHFFVYTVLRIKKIVVVSRETTLFLYSHLIRLSCSPTWAASTTLTPTNTSSCKDMGVWFQGKHGRVSAKFRRLRTQSPQNFDACGLRVRTARTVSPHGAD